MKKLCEQPKQPARGQLRRAAREKAGLSIREAAWRASVRESTLEGYEKGRRVPFHRAELLVRAYNCQLEIFL